MSLARKIQPKKPSRDWEAGARARLSRVTLEGNPFEFASSAYFRWREGWEYEDQQVKARVRQRQAGRD